MKRKISAKKQVRSLLSELVQTWASGQKTAFYGLLHSKLLQHKVRFPIVEHVTETLSPLIPDGEEFEFLEKIMESREIPTYVMAGKMLGLRLPLYLETAYTKAAEYIVEGNEWYVCDIISERVFGEGLLHDFEKGLTLMDQLRTADNSWLTRAPGVAVHLAVKRGVTPDQAHDLMKFLLQQFETRDFQTKKGAGWGVETIAKYHPTVALAYDEQVNAFSTNSWIKNKYKMGMKKAQARLAKLHNMETIGNQVQP